MNYTAGRVKSSVNNISVSRGCRSSRRYGLIQIWTCGCFSRNCLLSGRVCHSDTRLSDYKSTLADYGALNRRSMWL